MTDPGDVITLLRWTAEKLGINYRAVEVDFGHFSFDPRELPVLLLAGHNQFELTDEIRQRLARYVMDGGAILGDACCGWNDFAESFRREMELIFPARPLRKLPPEEPVFSSYYKLGELTYKRGDGSTFREPPCLEGINFGCRAGVLFSPRDLTCGWDGHEHPRGLRVVIDEARQVGANLITYLLGTFQLGRFLSTTKVYHEAAAPARDDLVFAQLIHEGDWDPDPSAVHNLLKFARDNSTLDVKFKRENVHAGDPKVATHPLLYMTGHYSFRLDRRRGGRLAAIPEGRRAVAGRRLLRAAGIRRRLPPRDRQGAAPQPARTPPGKTSDLPQPPRHPTGRVHASRARGFRATRCPGTGGHHARQPAGGDLQPLRSGQRLGAVPARL